ncbi:hypothetical protein BH11PLA2_BH11PLA2_02220 [soil metagenome]
MLQLQTRGTRIPTGATLTPCDKVSRGSLSIPVGPSGRGLSVLKRLAALIVVTAVCLAAIPAVRTRPPVTASTTDSVPDSRVSTSTEFEKLLTTDPVAVLEASLARFQREVRGYSCILQKQESLAGKPGAVEVIIHAVREEPFAVYMFWEQGEGSAKATLYVRGDNGGRMKVKTRFLVLDTDPNGILPRKSSRYSIEDAGIANGTRRSLRAWRAAREAGTLNVTYLGKQAIPELNGRECHVLKRVCTPAEVDQFRMTDPGIRNPNEFPHEAFSTITIMLDTETWMQIGSVLHRADGSLLGAYYFRDVVVNPAFAADQFTPGILKK